MTVEQPALQQAQRVADAVADLPGVVGITLGGSVASGMADAASDLDVYIYWRAPLAEPEQRAERLRPLADAGSLRMNILSWGLEDYLHLQGRLVEICYFNLDDMRANVERAYDEGLTSNGYTTAFLYTLAYNHLLHDPTGEVTALHQRLNASYPEPTRDKLLRHHPALLHHYADLLRRAQDRNDLLSAMHLRSEIQATFFDLLFALNQRYHPGEKRLLLHAQRCATQPPRLAERWEHIARLAADDPALADALQSLIDDLCTLSEEHQ